jgi:hypothetical protein
MKWCECLKREVENCGCPAAPSAPVGDVGELVKRLRERAGFALEENTATAISDARHFEEAADALNSLAARLAECEAADRQRDVRDKFLVERGLWGEFVKWLPDELPPVAAEARLAECEKREAATNVALGGALKCCERLTEERDEARTLNARLRQEAEIWAGEARCHKSTVHECYQAVTNATGAPGNWNGARPVVDELTRLRARVEALEKALGRIAAFDDSVANAKLAATGSYYYFDEPRAVKIARAALKAEAPNE